MFARFESEFDVCVVVAVWRCDVDDVDVGVGYKGFVTSVGFG
jgi:hypothetical protein